MGNAHKLYINTQTKWITCYINLQFTSFTSMTGYFNKIKT